MFFSFLIYQVVSEKPERCPDFMRTLYIRIKQKQLENGKKYEGFIVNERDKKRKKENIYIFA